MARRKVSRIPDALLDQLLAGADPKTALEADGLLDALKKALGEPALNAETDHHLAAKEAGNSRNGYGRKTVTTETGRIELSIPRDRQATFDPHHTTKRLKPRGFRSPPVISTATIRWMVTDILNAALLQNVFALSSCVPDLPASILAARHRPFRW